MTLVGNEAFPEVWGNRGTRAFSFIGTQEQRPNFEGNRGTDKIFGNREHKKTNLRFLGNRGTNQYILGTTMGTGHPPPPHGRVQLIS